MTNLAQILTHFGEVMGLNTNLAKSQIAPIRCENINLQNITEIFPAQVTHFPMKYLGLPLALSKLKKVHVQPLLDKCRKKMAPWQGKLLNTAGRKALTKSVLTAQPIYHMTALKLQDGIWKPSIKPDENSYGLEEKTSQGENARLTGKASVDPKSWEGLASWTSSSLQEPLDCDGFGLNGLRQKGLGQAPWSLAIS